MKKVAQKINKESLEIGILKSQLARALADYDNLRKRTDEEKITWIKFATQRLVQDLLPTLDTLEVAQEHIQDSGLAIAINQFKEILGNEELVEIRPKAGEKFDENLEEAIEVMEDKEKDNQIAELVISGWRFVDGSVVRHAKVKVFKAKK